MKFLFILSLFINSVAHTKSELKIRKCIKADGTISYQEKSCDNFASANLKPTATNQQTSLNKNHTNPLSQKPSAFVNQRNNQIKPSLSYQKLSKSNSHDLSTQIISDKVKSDHISLEVLSRWSMIKKVYNNKLLHMKFLDETPKSELSLLIDFTDPQGKIFNHSELADLSNLIGSRYARGSQEGEVNTKLFQVNQGRGVLATFTGSTIVNDYLYVTKGLIYKDDWLIQFTLQSNDLTSPGYQFALNSLSNSISIR
jgi:hypothetical protein